MRFLFVDSITEIKKNSHIKGIKRVSFEEGFLNSLSPEEGFLPRMLMMEAASQMVSWLILYSTDFLKMPLIAGIDYAEIKESVKCGESFSVDIYIESINSEGAVINSVIKSEDKTIAFGNRCLCTFADSSKLISTAHIKKIFADLSKEAIIID